MAAFAALAVFLCIQLCTCRYSPGFSNEDYDWGSNGYGYESYSDGYNAKSSGYEYEKEEYDYDHSVDKSSWSDESHGYDSYSDDSYGYDYDSYSDESYGVDYDSYSDDSYGNDYNSYSDDSYGVDYDSYSDDSYGFDYDSYSDDSDESYGFDYDSYSDDSYGYDYDSYSDDSYGYNYDHSVDKSLRSDESHGYDSYSDGSYGYDYDSYNDDSYGYDFDHSVDKSLWSDESHGYDSYNDESYGYDFDSYSDESYGYDYDSYSDESYGYDYDHSVDKSLWSDESHSYDSYNSYGYGRKEYNSRHSSSNSYGSDGYNYETYDYSEGNTYSEDSMDFGARYKGLGEGAENNYVLPADAAKKVYFIAAELEEHDYAPGKENTFNNDMSKAKDFIFNGEKQIGSTYTKIVYNQYTDDNFDVKVPKPAYMGYQGPILKGEVNSKIIVRFLNRPNTGRNLTIHPCTNLWYNDDSEGALFRDGTPIDQKLDDQVPPGGRWEYVWELREDYGPTEDDGNCLVCPYHAHFRPYNDINTGLVGLIIICKCGTLDEAGNRMDVDREYAVYLDQIDESASHRIGENLERCGNPAACQKCVASGNEDFLEKTTMLQINGYIYGNGPDFEMCSGERVAMYAYGLNTGTQSLSVYGQMMTYQERRIEAVGVGSGIAKEVILLPETPGRFLIGNTNICAFEKGMFAFVKVNECEGLAPLVTIPSGKVRRYYLAAEETRSKFAPEGVEVRAGRATKERIESEKAILRDGTVKRGMFVGYTDGSFKNKMEKPGYQGGLGPTIYAEVGDTVVVYLKNKMRKRPASFVPIGLDITKENEGMYYRADRDDENLSGKLVQPGETEVYEFIVPESHSANNRLGLNCYSTYYHSNGVGWVEDMNFGLSGTIVVCRREGLSQELGIPVGFTKHFSLQFADLDISTDGYNDGKDMVCDKRKDKNVYFPVINGRQFGNLPGMEICLGESVIFTLHGVGCMFDGYQSVIFEGNRVGFNGKTVDFAMMWPGEAITVTMTPDNRGVWNIKSGQTHFQERGMIAQYTVRECGNRASLPPRSLLPEGRVRRFYIAAIKILWDFAENKMHPVLERDMRIPEVFGNLYVRDTSKFVGTKYIKTVYRQFTDGSFKKMVKRDERSIHLGTLGPMFHVEVNDEVEVVFKNMADEPHTITLRNLMGECFMVREQNEEGVAPGQRKTYTWYVPESAGPAARDPNCVARSYESTTNPIFDSNAGLLGAFAVCRQGTLDEDGNRRDDSTREFAVNFQTIDENESHHSRENFKKFARRRKDVNDPKFVESNMMHAVNGKIFFNTPGLNMTVGSCTYWYSVQSGGEDSLNPQKYHGHPVMYNTNGLISRRSVVVSGAGLYDTFWICPTTHASVWMYRNGDVKGLFDGMMISFTISNE